MGLPRLDLPPDALILFESAPAGPDPVGAYRFAVTHDGRFLHSSNGDRTEDDDDHPDRYWATPLEHLATFDAETVRALEQAGDEVRRLPSETRAPPGRESHPTFERITVAGATADHPPHTTTANARARPPEVAKLLEIVERAGKDQG